MGKPFTVGPFKFVDANVTSICPPSIEDFEEAIQQIGWMQRNNYWWLGRLINMGERFHGDDIYQGFDASFSPELLQRCAAVANKWPAKDCNPNLSWSHHIAVGKLPPALRKIALDMAEEEGWTSTDLTKYVRNAAAKEEMLRRLGISQDEDSAGSQG